MQPREIPAIVSMWTTSHMRSATLNPLHTVLKTGDENFSIEQAHYRKIKRVTKQYTQVAWFAKSYTSTLRNLLRQYQLRGVSICQTFAIILPWLPPSASDLKVSRRCQGKKQTLLLVTIMKPCQHMRSTSVQINTDIHQLLLKGGGLVIYDLQGRKIQVGGLHELTTGVYIINGKKVVIKWVQSHAPHGLCQARDSLMFAIYWK